MIGISKGKGFQGVVRRHGFHGSPASHGHKDQLRMPGSIGATGPARVFKGKKMPGRMGGEQVTVKNLEVADVDAEKNILALRGAVPGPRNGLIVVFGQGELNVVEAVSQENEEVQEDGDQEGKEVNSEEVKEVEKPVEKAEDRVEKAPEAVVEKVEPKTKEDKKEVEDVQTSDISNQTSGASEEKVEAKKSNNEAK